MPKLYYSPYSCAAASFISASIAGAKLDVEQVDIGTHKTNSGKDFYAINPKGNVPTIVLDDGTTLNENVACLLFVADQKPNTVGPAGSNEKYALLAVLAYLSTEVHPAVGAFFAKTESADIIGYLKDIYNKKLTYIENTLVGDKKYLVGNKFSVADAYLYIILSWINFLGGKIDLKAFPKTKAYWDGIAALEGVKAAHTRMETNPATTI